MPHPGDLLGDRYRLDDRIATGGMGEVWRATDTVLGRDVAVKTLRAGPASDTGFRTRFRNEARAMAVLHHPGVADVYDYGQQGPDAYIVMARVHGEPLNQLLADRGRLSPAETMSVVAQAGLALEAAHEAGIVHRDVKPGNLIVQPDGTVILVDFGVARAAGSPTLTGAKEVVGTALYIAPEQLSKQTTGPAADLYALGAVAYHCLAGHPPFVGPSPVAVAMMHLSEEPPPLPEDIPADVRDLVTKAMAKDPADRFPSAAAMAGAAEEILASSDEAASPRTTTTAVLAAFPDPAPLRPTATNPTATNTTATNTTGTAPLPAVVPPPGSGTAILPGLPAAGRRKRALLLSTLAALILGTAAAALILINPGDHGGTPAPAVSPSVKPSTSHSPTTTRGGQGPATTTRRPSPTTTTPTAPASAAPTSPAPTKAATTPPPSRAPTTEPTTAAPEETETGTAPASEDAAG